MGFVSNFSQRGILWKTYLFYFKKQTKNNITYTSLFLQLRLRIFVDCFNRIDFLKHIIIIVVHSIL